MTYNELVTLVRRVPFTPLLVHLHDGRTYELRGFGDFMLIPSGLTVRLPYVLDRATTKSIDYVRIAFSDIKEATELASSAFAGGVGHGSA